MSKNSLGEEVPGILSGHTQEKYGNPPPNYQRFLDLFHKGEISRVVVTAGVDSTSFDLSVDGTRSAALTTRLALTASGNFSHIVNRVIFY